MKSSLLIWIVLGGMLMNSFTCSGCNAEKADVKNIEYNTKVYIDGIEQSFGCIIHNTEDDSAIIFPLIETLVALGADVRWTSDDVATLYHESAEYILNLKEVYLLPKDGERDNLLLIPPGCRVGVEVIDKDVLVDSSILIYVINCLGIDFTSLHLDKTNNLFEIITAN